METYCVYLKKKFDHTCYQQRSSSTDGISNPAILLRERTIYPKHKTKFFIFNFGVAREQKPGSQAQIGH